MMSGKSPGLLIWLFFASPRIISRIIKKNALAPGVKRLMAVFQLNQLLAVCTEVRLRL